MTEEISNKVMAHYMKSGCVYVGICSDINWENKTMHLKEASLFFLKNKLINEKRLKERIKKLYESNKNRNNYTISIDKIVSGYILK